MSKAATLAGLALAVASCSGPAPAPAPAPAPVPIPARASTAGDALVAVAPSGADLIVEIDAARLRANTVVGPVFSSFVAGIGRSVASGAGHSPIAWAGKLSDLTSKAWLAALEYADSALLCVYGMGADRARAVILLAGDNVSQLAIAGASGHRFERASGRTVWAMGPPALIRGIERVLRGDEPSLVENRSLLATRAQIMPAAASGASLRMAARFDFEARVSVAAALDVDIVPAEFALWGDVADDLAVVAGFRGADNKEVADLRRGLIRMRDRIAGHVWVRQHMLHFAMHTIDIRRHRSEARAVLVIGPTRLLRMMKRAAAALDRSPELQDSSP